MKTEPENHYFVESLKRRLALKGMTGVELARVEVSGGRLCTEQHLSRVLNYKQPAGRNFRNKFADWLGVSVHEMINEGHALVTGSSQITGNGSAKKDRRLSDIHLSRLAMDELSTAISMYGSEVYKKYIEIAAELQNRAKAERMAEKELNFYRQILDQSPAAIMILSVPGKVIVYRNEAHIKLEGTDLLGQACGAECVLNDSILDQVVTSRTTSTQVIESTNGKIYSVLSWPLFDAQGQMVFMASVARDITQRYHETGVANTAAKRYEAVLSRVAPFVTIFDERKRMVYSNSTRAGGLLEHAPGADLKTFQSTALYLQKILVMEDWQAAVDAIQASFDAKKPGSYRSRLKDGRLLSGDSVPIMDGEVFRGVAVMSQITSDG